jgi:glycogen(starch) synthase
MKKQLTLAYAAGPGDVVTTFRQWQKGFDDPHQVAITYSGQFFDLCKKINAKGVILSSNPRRDMVQTDCFHVENVPVVPAGSGLHFHKARMWSSLHFLQKARQYGGQVFIISDATGHWFPFSLARRKGEIFIPSLHCVLWSRFSGVSASRRILNLLERPFFKSAGAGILAVSREIGKQVATITGDPTIGVKLFHPTYRSNTFDAVSSPPDVKNGFRLFFAGRLETEKGVYELLQVAKKLKDLGRKDISFDILGIGSQEQNLRRESGTAGLQSLFRMHGYCNRPRLLEILAASHAIVVPTATSFNEGFNKVVAEGVLSGRPVITSSACPALYSVREAVLEVLPDNADSYLKAIIQLTDDSLLYEQKRQSCADLAPKFYNSINSWGAGLEEIVGRVDLLPGRNQVANIHSGFRSTEMG